MIRLHTITCNNSWAHGFNLSAEIEFLGPVYKIPSKRVKYEKNELNLSIKGSKTPKFKFLIAKIGLSAFNLVEVSFLII